MNPMKVSLLLVCAGGVAMAADHNWSTGKVLDSTATRNVLQTGATVSGNSFGSATANTSGSAYGK